MRVFATRILALIGLFTAPALAQEVPPDAEFDKAKTVAVQPLLVAGPSAAAAWNQIAGFLNSESTGTARALTRIPALSGLPAHC